MPAPTERSALVAWLADLQQLLRWIEDRSQARQAMEATFQPYAKPKRRWGTKQLVWCLVIGWAAVVLVVMPIIAPFFNATGALVFGTPVGVAVGACFWALRNHKLLTQSNAKLAHQNQAVETHNRHIEAQLQPVLDQLTEAGRTYVRRFADGYPDAYAYEEAVAFVLQAVQNHRADTVGQAINLYEEWLHRQRMEQTQQAILAEQERTRKQMVTGQIISTVMQGATISAIHSEGAATRAAVNQPRTIRFK